MYGVVTGNALLIVAIAALQNDSIGIRRQLSAVNNTNIRRSGNSTTQRDGISVTTFGTIQNRISSSKVTGAESIVKGASIKEEVFK